MFKDLAEKIKHLNYVVQRNWDNLPQSCEVGEHKDLDLFVSEEDRDELVTHLESYYELVDVRSPRDDYYPKAIADQLLASHRWHGGFRIPSEGTAFIALYYHNLVHKDGDPYKYELEELFLEAYPPVQCADHGVGYYI